jgi:hypothetical protein
VLILLGTTVQTGRFTALKAGLAINRRRHS